jgi:hypothetical protein
MTRDHFRLLYSRRPQDLVVNPNAAAAIFTGLQEHFAEQADLFRRDSSPAKAALPFEFPVILHDGSVVAAALRSPILLSPPPTAFDYIFVDREIMPTAKRWLDTNLKNLIVPKGEE